MTEKDERAPGKKPKIVVIVGPTASGKTSLSITLAKKFKGEIISADSRQVYRTLDIGTEKITKEEMSDIPHHLIDWRDPEESYTAFDFAKDADKKIEEITTRGHVPFIVGGTFFYLDALLETQALPQVPPNPKLREELEMKSIEELAALLKEKDPERANTIDIKNPRRLVRALEIIEALGSVPRSQPVPDKYDVYFLGLTTTPGELRGRIEKRLHETLEKGLVAETKRVLESGLSKERLQEIGLEYRVVLEYLDGTITETELEQKLIEKVWQYAKRQRTWLKRMEEVHWHEPGEIEAISEEIEIFLR